MAIERKWPAIAPRQATANGTVQGIITLANTRDFRVKMAVVLQSNSLPAARYQVKRVTKTTLVLGPVPQPGTQKAINERSDLTQWTVADGTYVYTEEQDKSMLKPDDANQATYEQEPVVARRVINVDQYGNFYDADNSLPVIQGGRQITPPEFDDVVIDRDAEDYPTKYRFLLREVQVSSIDVTYNNNRSSIRYKRNDNG